MKPETRTLLIIVAAASLLPAGGSVAVLTLPKPAGAFGPVVPAAQSAPAPSPHETASGPPDIRDIQSRVRLGMTREQVTAIAGSEGDAIGGDTIPGQSMPGLQVSFNGHQGGISLMFHRDENREWRVVQIHRPLFVSPN